MCVYMYVCACVCALVYVCMCACVCLRMCVWCVCVCVCDVVCVSRWVCVWHEASMCEGIYVFNIIHRHIGRQHKTRQTNQKT